MKYEFGLTTGSKLFSFDSNRNKRQTRYEILNFNPEDVEYLYDEVKSKQTVKTYSNGENIMEYNQKRMVSHW